MVHISIPKGLKRHGLPTLIEIFYTVFIAMSIGTKCFIISLRVFIDILLLMSGGLALRDVDVINEQL